MNWMEAPDIRPTRDSQDGQYYKSRLMRLDQNSALRVTLHPKYSLSDQVKSLQFFTTLAFFA